jgi:hypothetical protein
MYAGGIGGGIILQPRQPCKKFCPCRGSRSEPINDVVFNFAAEPASGQKQGQRLASTVRGKTRFVEGSAGDPLKGSGFTRRFLKGSGFTRRFFEGIWLRPPLFERVWL